MEGLEIKKLEFIYKIARIKNYKINKTMKYDLEERCAKFGEDVIIFCKTVKKNDFAVWERIIWRQIKQVQRKIFRIK